jgi:tripeptidyl-peptidase-1
VAPSQDTATQVQSWLALNNLTSSPLTAAGDWITVDMTVSQANRLLAAEFSMFQNEETNHTVDRTLSYAIPSILKSGINTIYPTVTFVFPPFSASTESHAQYLRSSRGSEQIGFCCKCDGNKPGANPPTASISSDCQVDWTPACLQQLYNIPPEPT